MSCFGLLSDIAGWAIVLLAVVGIGWTIWLGATNSFATGEEDIHD